MRPIKYVPRSNWWKGTPVNNDWSARPKMTVPAEGIAVHYRGAPARARLGTQSAEEYMPGEQAWALSAGKSFEYNYLIPPRADGSAQVWEYAGEYRGAHAGVENNKRFIAVQFALGVDNHPSYASYDRSKPTVWEPLTDEMVDAFRWLRHKLVSEGRLRPDHKVVPDRHLPGRQTACPGDAVLGRWNDLLVPWETGSKEPEMQMVKIRLRDRNGVEYADQFLAVPLTGPGVDGSPGSNARIGAENQAAIVATVNMSGFELQQLFPYKLTAM